MKIDWHKETGKWTVYDIETDRILCRVDRVKIYGPCELVSTDGGRHGYLIAAGQLVIDTDTAIISRS